MEEEKNKYKMCLLKRNRMYWQQKFPEGMAVVGRVVTTMAKGNAVVVAVYPMVEEK